MIYTPDEALHVAGSVFHCVSFNPQRRPKMSLSVEDLVASLNASHIGQEAIDLAALHVRTINVILRFPTFAYLCSSWGRRSSLRRSSQIRFLQHIQLQVHPTHTHMLRTQMLLGVIPAQPLLHALLLPLSRGRQVTYLLSSLGNATIVLFVRILVDQA